MEGRERLHVVAISQTSSLMDLSDPQRHHDPGVTLASRPNLDGYYACVMLS